MDTCRRCGTVVPDEAVCYVCNANKEPQPLVVDFTATQTFTPLPVKQPAPKPAAKSPSKGDKSNAVKKGKK